MKIISWDIGKVHEQNSTLVGVGWLFQGVKQLGVGWSFQGVKVRWFKVLLNKEAYIALSHLPPSFYSVATLGIIQVTYVESVRV